MFSTGLASGGAKAKRCLILACLPLVGCVAARGADAPQDTPRLEDIVAQRIRELPPDKQKEAVKKLIESGWFLDLPEFWQTCDDLDTTLRAVSRFGEPLSSPMLDALERNIDTSRDAGKRFGNRFQAAALLYRYDRSAGRAMLLHQLKMGNVSAATVFAMNREAELLDDILKTFSRAKGDDEHDGELIRVLGDWRNPRIEAVLLQQFKVALKSAELDCVVCYASALAAQQSRKAIPWIWKTYKLLPPTDRSDVAVALIRLKVKESDQLMADLLAQLKTKETKFSHSYLLMSVGQAGSPQAVETLRRVIEDYLATPGPPPGHWGVPYDQTDPDELAVIAAEQLAKLKVVETQDLLARFLLRLAEDYKANAKSRLRFTVARALLSLDTSKSQPVVEQVLGSKWLHKELLLQQLKPLPFLWVGQHDG